MSARTTRCRSAPYIADFPVQPLLGIDEFLAWDGEKHQLAGEVLACADRRQPHRDAEPAHRGGAQLRPQCPGCRQVSGPRLAFIGELDSLRTSDHPLADYSAIIVADLNGRIFQWLDRYGPLLTRSGGKPRRSTAAASSKAPVRSSSRSASPAPPPKSIAP
jgi:hypothetical protein